MTLLATIGSQKADAVRLLSAIGDVFAGHRIGFGMQVANVAARFAVYRERDPETIAAIFYAAALHEIGAVRIVTPRGAPARVVEIASWDDPPAGAAIVAAIGGFPAATADAIRWHRESFDGTGFPDQLRWNSIPETAMTINIARAFVAAFDDQGGGSPQDAVFGLANDSGCRYSLSAMSDFREFLAAEGDACDAAYEPSWPLREHGWTESIVRVCDEIDARDSRTAGRGYRLERLIRTIVARLGATTIDPDRAVFAGRLTAVARNSNDGSADDIFMLTRLGSEARATRAKTSARILAAAPTFAEFGPIVGSIEEWYDGTGFPDRRGGEDIDPIARVLAVAIAAEAITAPDAARRIRAAAGTRLDPAVVAAYLDGGER